MASSFLLRVQLSRNAEGDTAVAAVDPMVVGVDFMAVVAVGSMVEVASTAVEDLAEGFVAAEVLAAVVDIGVDSVAAHEPMAAEGFEARAGFRRGVMAVLDLADMDLATGVAWAAAASGALGVPLRDAALWRMAIGIPLETTGARRIPLERQDFETRQ
ncbi:MAG: hypothetical protein WBE20_13155 [Candidatus Acidiferrales bacterium]